MQMGFSHSSGMQKSEMRFGAALCSSEVSFLGLQMGVASLSSHSPPSVADHLWPLSCVSKLPLPVRTQASFGSHVKALSKCVFTLSPVFLSISNLFLKNRYYVCIHHCECDFFGLFVHLFL